MGLFGGKNKQRDISAQIDGITKMARNKTFGEIERSLITAKKESRLIFHDNGLTDYTDRQGNHGAYNDEQLSAKLWQIFDNKLSEVKFGGMTAGLTLLAITELDIKEIVLKVKGG